MGEVSLDDGAKNIFITPSAAPKTKPLFGGTSTVQSKIWSKKNGSFRNAPLILTIIKSSSFHNETLLHIQINGYDITKPAAKV